MQKKGFTLIELLIVIAIIAIIAAVAFVALNPLARFQDSRDASRWQDVSALLTAIKVDQIDNGGSYLPAIASTTAGQVYMIGTDANNCETFDAFCDVNVNTSTNCVDLSGLVDDGYLASVPVSPNGDGVWTAGHTGYTLEKGANGTLEIRSCESEGSDGDLIELAR